MRSEYISKVDTLSFNTFDSTDTLAAITQASGGTLLLKAYDIAGVEEAVTLDGDDKVSDWSNGGATGIHTITIDPDDFVAGTRYRLTLEDAKVGGESIDGITIMEIKIAPQEVDLVKVNGTDITSGTPDVNVVTVAEDAKEEISAKIMDDLAAAIVKLEALYARFYHKVSKTATDIIVYDTDGVTPLTTQAYTEGATDTVHAPTV